MPGIQTSELDRIREAATFWHANTVRIQVAQEYLFNQSPVNSIYLAALDNETNLANRLGMVAIATLQEESFNGAPLPDASSVLFWNFMAQHYKTIHW